MILNSVKRLRTMISMPSAKLTSYYPVLLIHILCLNFWGKSDSKAFMNDLWVQNYCKKTSSCSLSQKVWHLKPTTISVPGEEHLKIPKARPIPPTDINKKHWPFQHCVIQLFFTAVNSPVLQFWQFASNLFFSPCQIKLWVKLYWSLIGSCYPHVI